MGSETASPDRREGQARTGERRVDLDRLRLLACLVLFLYHGVQIFDLNPYYHIKSSTPSAAIDVAARLILAVHMPLFFLIAGMAAFLHVNGRSDGDVLRGRAWRLLIPFLFGVLLLTPWIKYVEVLDGRNISWRGLLPLDGRPITPEINLWRYFTHMRWFSWSHMWFLLYLFLFTALLLPALRAMERGRSEPHAPPLLLVALPLLPLAAAEFVLRPYFPWHIPNLIADWASMTVYVVCFLAGAALVRWRALELALQRWMPGWVVLAACCAVLYVSAEGAVALGLGRALWLWSALCLCIALGPVLARGRLPGERYLAEAVLPIYVLHHLPLVVIGYHVKDLEWPIWQRYWAIVLGALLVTLVVHHLAVRPFDPMRVALGLPRRRH